MPIRGRTPYAAHLSWIAFLSALIVSLAIAIPMSSAAEELTEDELAKKTQNPIADLISLPFQNNTSYKSGPRERTQNTLNIQPVVPIGLGENFTLITRTIIPIVSQPSTARGESRQDGIGDTSLSLFLSPKKPLFGALIFGAGPVFNIPTASDDALGADKWGMGLTAVGLTMQGPVVAGLLISNTWSLEGEDFSRFLLQPIFNYNLSGGWYLTSVPIMTADWEAEDNAWLVPVGGGFGKVHRIEGFPPMNIQVQAFYNAEKPKNGADWSTRFQLQLLFPK